MRYRGSLFARVLSCGVAAVLVGLGAGSAQAPDSLLVVSKPPPAVVPSDPPQGLVFRVPTDLSASSLAFSAGGPVALEYLRLGGGAAYVTFEDGPQTDAPGGVMVVPNFLEGGGFASRGERLITGGAAGLVAPKDLIVLEEDSLVIVSDFGGARVAAFALDADGDTAPSFTLADLGMSAGGEARRPWGLAFDEATGRLFVGATDGTVLVFDGVLNDHGAGGPDRVITPSFDGEQVSANTHDLLFIAETGQLIVSDVGSATTADQEGFERDGMIFVIGGAGEAEGATEVELYLAGESTLLGNPVALAYDGTSLYVAEKAGDVVLRFDDFLSLTGRQDLFPSGAVTVAQPEAIELVRSR